MAAMTDWPTEERIREICEEIRRGWTPSQEISRRVVKLEQYTIPVITMQSYIDHRSELWKEIANEERCSNA